MGIDCTCNCRLRYRQRLGDASADAAWYALFTLLGKYANLQGVLPYWKRLITGGRRTLIEYKQT